MGWSSHVAIGASGSVEHIASVMYPLPHFLRKKLCRRQQALTTVVAVSGRSCMFERRQRKRFDMTPNRVLANATSSAQTIVEYHLAFIHVTPAVWALQVLCQRERTVPNENVGGQDLRSRQCGGLRKVGRFRVHVRVQRALPPNPAVCVAPVLADVSVEELQIGVHDRHQHHAEAPFIISK